MDGRLHPLVQAAQRELSRIHVETGGASPNLSSEYAAARRVYRAVLDAADLAADECSKIQRGERTLEVVK